MGGLANAYIDGAQERNPFLLLSRHQGRHDENYLTQCLCTVFNVSPRFREALCSVLARQTPRLQRRLAGRQPEHLLMRTQQSHANRTGELRNIIDAVIHDGSVPLVAIEAKLHAATRADQLEKYLSAFRHAHSGCELVLLALSPDLSEVSEAARKAVAGVGWPEVYKAAQHATRHRGRRDHADFLLEAFMGFLEWWGVVAPKALDSADMKRICQLGALADGAERYAEIGRADRALHALATAASRLELHRDLEWGLCEDAGWTPITFLGRSHEMKGAPGYVWLYVGYRTTPNGPARRAGVRLCWFGMELQLSRDGSTAPPALRITSQRSLSQAHPAKDKYPEKLHFRLAPSKTRALFAKDFDEAHQSLRVAMRDALKVFKLSATWRAGH